MPLPKKISLGVLLFFAFYTITGFFIAPPIVKWVLTKKLAERLHREVAIQKIKFNPYKLSTNVIGFTIENREDRDRFVSFNDLYIDLQAASIYKKGLILKEVKIDGPYINIILSDDSSYNFSDLLEADKGAEKSADDSGPFRFSINNIQILNGSADFLDGPKMTKHKVRDLTISIPMVSNFPYFIETFVQPFLKASVNDTDFIVKGKTKPFSDSLETIVDLDIKGFDLPYYIGYVPYKLNFSILSGTIDAKSTLTFTQYSNRPSSFTVAGDISLHDLQIVDKDNNKMISIPVYALKHVALDLGKKELSIGEVSSKNGEFFVKRYKDGTVNMKRPLPKIAEKIEEIAEDKEETPWIINIDKIIYDGYSIKVEDHVPDNPVNLTAGQIDLRAENVSTRKDSRGTLSYSFKFNETGTVSGESSFGINPVSADVKLSLQNIGIVPLQSYFTDKVKILVTDGSVSTDGILSYATSEEGEFNANFNGDVSLIKFASVDKVNANDFLKWKSLYLNGINFKLTPLNVLIDEVALTDFYSRLIINPDGSINVQDIVKTDKKQAEDLPEPVEMEEVAVERDGSDDLIKINTVTLQAGTVNFSDRHIKPEYSATLLKVGGRVSGLSSEEGTLAEVDLRGNLENYAPLEIKGKINPLIEDLYVDLKLDFKDIDLSPLTPYAIKYIGYTIQKGKLSLDLQYLIVNKKLDSRNNIFIDQFTFGDKVDSPDATTLPVKFAISLLKNSKGEISLDLPVAGTLDDPEFRLGGLVLKMVVNILVKAATSPFALLGSIVGGGEELSTVGFDYGSIDLNDPEKANLDKLTTALGDRPNLNIEIEGFVDIERDREGLRQFTFNKKLRAQKLKEILDKGSEAITIDEISIKPEEYELYLGKAYKKETFPKPRNVLGFTKKLSVPEMEKLILAYIEITDDDLRLLASARALKVKDYILKSGQVDQKRIFLTEPQSLQPEEKEKLRNSRVDFKLK